MLFNFSSLLWQAMEHGLGVAHQCCPANSRNGLTCASFLGDSSWQLAKLMAGMLAPTAVVEKIFRKCASSLLCRFRLLLHWGCWCQPDQVQQHTQPGTTAWTRSVSTQGLCAQTRGSAPASAMPLRRLDNLLLTFATHRPAWCGTIYASLVDDLSDPRPAAIVRAPPPCAFPPSPLAPCSSRVRAAHS